MLGSVHATLLTPALKTDFYGAYGEVSYDQTAKNWFNMQMGGVCTPAVNPGGVKSTTLTAGAVNECTPDFQYFHRPGGDGRDATVLGTRFKLKL